MRSLAALFWIGMLGIACTLIYWGINGFNWDLVMSLDSPWFLPFLVVGLLFWIVVPFAWMETSLRRIRVKK